MTWCEMLEVRVSEKGFVACMLQGRRSPINGPSGQAGYGKILTFVFLSILIKGNFIFPSSILCIYINSRQAACDILMQSNKGTLRLDVFMYKGN
jgi:hypothetical protein